MKNQVAIIDQRELLGNNFCVYGNLENPLFLAKDVAEWIEHTNARMMLQSVDESEKVCVNNPYALKGQKEQWFLTEDGLYEVLMQSRKPIAKQFKKSVKAVLKELRMKGFVDLRNKEQTKAQLAEARQRNARSREASIYLKLADRVTVETYRQILISKSAEVLAGQMILPLPSAPIMSYSAKDIGDMLGISGNMVGRLANKYGLKTPEYGELVWDKSQSSAHQCQTFRYYISVVPVLQKLIEEVA